MNKTKILGALGFVILVVSILLLTSNNPYWYVLFMFGGLLFFGSVNYYNNEDSIFKILFTNKKRAIKIYFVYILVGVIVEAVRMISDMWEYVAPYNNSILLPIFLLLGYPVFLSFILESFILIKHFLRHKYISIILTFIFVYIWNEISNVYLVRLWVVNSEFDSIIGSVFFIGYVFEVLISIYARELIKK